MKKLLRMYSYLIQPTIYKITSRAFLGITFSLLWNYFINENGTYIMVEKTFFFVGIVLLTMAWFNYLKLDGISIGMRGKDNKRKDKSGHQSKNIIDFLEEDVTSDELEEDDEILSAIIANIFTGICFLIPSIIAIYL
ncbi:hypothetical protein RBU61_06100 [Tissierella sp. MB52-C2]|uniref:hypothetical protein n=1 Tax=Tissierella sp. MB52-C2 TaxID=3070999 RepID=UPI00280B6028|nr:hypothetical protein [Tissierella sp. MB52-C2]WMM26246.1 hypothetical protein RBU61_06100 [Tissierella sp. MB52-C2]